jgi:hypothetical protein
MRLGAAVSRVIVAVVIMAGSTCSAHGLAQLLAGFRPMLFQGTPGFSTTPASPIDLGPSAVGVTTPHAFPQPLQINNPGTAPLSISGSSFTPFEAGFTAESLFLPPISINPGATRTPGVLFFPQGPGKRTIELSIIDNAPGSPHIVEFTGTGVAVPANDIGIILDPSLTTVNVTAGSSTTFPIWLLAGPGGSTNINVTVQCSGGASGALCTLDHNTDILTADSFGNARQIHGHDFSSGQVCIGFSWDAWPLVDGCFCIRSFIAGKDPQECAAFCGHLVPADCDRPYDFLWRQ